MGDDSVAMESTTKDAHAPELNATAHADAAPELSNARAPVAPGSYQTRPMGAAYLAPARSSASATVPGVLSQDNDRLGRIYGRGVLEANWYEERLQAEAGILKGPQDEVPILRPFEPDLSAVQREMTGGLATLSRTKRYPFMLASHSVVSDGFNEHATMSETFFAPLHRRLPNPVEDGITTTSDQMNLAFAQYDSPKTRRSKDRMSNVVDEVRAIADSDAKVRKRFVNAANFGRVYARAPPELSAYGAFGAVVPTHPQGYASRHFSTTTRDALVGGLRGEAAGVRAALAPPRAAPHPSCARRRPPRTGSRAPRPCAAFLRPPLSPRRRQPPPPAGPPTFRAAATGARRPTTRSSRSASPSSPTRSCPAWARASTLARRVLPSHSRRPPAART